MPVIAPTRIDYRRIADCLCCGQRKRTYGRGLCGKCYSGLRRGGELDLYPRLGPASDVDIVDETGATYRQIDYWVRQGYLHPEKPVPGSGVHRLWSDAEVQIAAKMTRLVLAGLTPAAASRVARGEHDIAPGVRVEVS